MENAFNRLRLSFPFTSVGGARNLGTSRLASMINKCPFLLAYLLFR
jgi:hypothetical protein